MLRPLHYVLRIGNRNDIKNFFINALGMKVLRHEEFSEGCDAACNGPYDGKWSKTMIGYEDEDDSFVLELTYNYGIGSYDISNDLQYIKICSSRILSNVKNSNFKWTLRESKPESILVKSPDGYPFLISNEDVLVDQQSISEVNLTVNNDMKETVDYYSRLLPGCVAATSDSVLYNIGAGLRGGPSESAAHTFRLTFTNGMEKIRKTSASGRIAFSWTGKVSDIEAQMKDKNQKIHTSLVTLDTPGKASVEVVILLDPNGHEICVVGDQGFRELSRTDPAATTLLEQAIVADKSDEWFNQKKGGKPTG